MKLPKGIPSVLILAFTIVILALLFELIYLGWRYPSLVSYYFLEPTVIAVSDLPSFEVKPTDGPALLEYLKELKLFDKEKVRKVTVHLTDKLQTSRAIGDSQGITMASDFQTEGIVLHLYIYLRPDVLAKTVEIRSSSFNTGLLGALADSVEKEGDQDTRLGSLPKEVLERFMGKNDKYLTKPYLIVEK